MERKQVKVMQNSQKQIRTKRIDPKLLKICINAFIVLCAVILFIVANIYNNRWARSITQLEQKIQTLEVKLEKEKIKKQEYSSKSRLEEKVNGNKQMHYSSDNIVVVSKFSDN